VLILWDRPSLVALPRDIPRPPRFARGKLGTIHRNRGVHVFPDTNVHSLGEKPQRLYSAHFAARER